MPQRSQLDSSDLTYEQAYAIAAGLDRFDLSGASDQDIGLFLARLARLHLQRQPGKFAVRGRSGRGSPTVNSAGAALDELIKGQRRLGPRGR